MESEAWRASAHLWAWPLVYIGSDAFKDDNDDDDCDGDGDDDDDTLCEPVIVLYTA